MMENNFSVEEIEKILFKLLGGDVEPFGDSAIDSESYDRLMILLGLMKDLHCKVDRLAEKYEDSRLGSCRKIGKACSEYLDWLGIEK